EVLTWYRWKWASACENDRCDCERPTIQVAMNPCSQFFNSVAQTEPFFIGPDRFRSITDIIFGRDQEDMQGRSRREHSVLTEVGLSFCRQKLIHRVKGEIAFQPEITERFLSRWALNTGAREADSG